MPPPATVQLPPFSPRKVWHVGTLVYTASGLVALFCWLLWGDFAWQLSERAALPVMQLMLLKFHASDFTTGLLVLSLPSAVFLALVPVVSYLSDRHRGRWGRRLPYLLVPAPIVMLSMYGLAFSPAIGAWLHAWTPWPVPSLDATIIVVMGVFWMGFQLATLTANAIFGGLVNDVVPRELLGRFFGMFRAVSLLSAMFFNFYLIGHAKEHFRSILIGIGTLYGVGVILMCLKVREGGYPPPAPTPIGATLRLATAVKSYFRDCFSNPYYLLIFVSLTLAALTLLPMNIYGLYAAQSFGMSMGAYGKYLTITFACSLGLAYPLGWMADRFHAIRIGLAALAAYALVMGAGYFFVHGPSSFGLVFIGQGVLAGCYYTGTASLAQMLFPKLKFTQFASASGFMVGGCSMVAAPSLGILFDRTGHDYRCLFAVASLLSLLALLTSFMVYRRFMILGGPRDYEPPA